MLCLKIKVYRERNVLGRFVHLHRHGVRFQVVKLISLNSKAITDDIGFVYDVLMPLLLFLTVKPKDTVNSVESKIRYKLMIVIMIFF
jgi:rRNA processing protein Gar1